jgi:hypothetical protein
MIRRLILGYAIEDESACSVVLTGFDLQAFRETFGSGNHCLLYQARTCSTKLRGGGHLCDGISNMILCHIFRPFF